MPGIKTNNLQLQALEILKNRDLTTEQVSKRLGTTEAKARIALNHLERSDYAESFIARSSSLTRADRLFSITDEGRDFLAEISSPGRKMREDSGRGRRGRRTGFRVLRTRRR